MIDWKHSPHLIPYPDALAAMDARVAGIVEGRLNQQVWLLEHPPLYTGGTSADVQDLVDPDRFDVFKSQRGGQYTYHGPGQRIAYAMLDLNVHGKDVRLFVQKLEDWVIATLAEFGVEGVKREGRVGVWVVRKDKPKNAMGHHPEDKIAAIGVRLRKWVSLHGISINVEPDLSHYDGIIPCGIQEHGVTSLVDLGLPVTMSDVDIVLKEKFAQIFGSA